VTAILRVIGLSHERHFQNYHRVLNRAKWSSRALSGILLRLLVAVFVSKEAPIVVGIDETIERRHGARIATKGIYRDAVQREQRVFRENQRVAMDLDAAVGSHSLGWACVGVALFHGAGPHTRATIRSIDGATKNSPIGDGK
jgi:DDE superfamily endonuclease